MSFNAELAYKVLDLIERSVQAQADGENPGMTWNQHNWREVNSCGTALCFAGWVGELEGRWFVSTEVMDELSSHDASVLHATWPWTQLVPYGDPDRDFPMGWPLMPEDITDAGLQDPETVLAVLKRHHGELEQYRQVSVANWAAVQLGLGDDPLDLFSGTNTLAQLRYVVDFYATYGTTEQAACEHAEELMEHGVRPLCCAQHASAYLMDYRPASRR